MSKACVKSADIGTSALSLSAACACVAVCLLIDCSTIAPMTGMHIIGTLLWIGVLLSFGALAVSEGAVWSWLLFLGCLSVFVALALVSRRTRRSPQLR